MEFVSYFYPFLPLYALYSCLPHKKSMLILPFMQLQILISAMQKSSSQAWNSVILVKLRGWSKFHPDSMICKQYWTLMDRFNNVDKKKKKRKKEKRKMNSFKMLSVIHPSNTCRTGQYWMERGKLNCSYNFDLFVQYGH